MQNSSHYLHRYYAILFSRDKLSSGNKHHEILLSEEVIFSGNKQPKEERKQWKNFGWKLFYLDLFRVSNWMERLHFLHR